MDILTCGFFAIVFFVAFLTFGCNIKAAEENDVQCKTKVDICKPFMTMSLLFLAISILF